MPTARVSPAERCKPACKPRVNRSRKKEKRTGRLKATADRRRQRELPLPAGPPSLSPWDRGLPERKKEKKRKREKEKKRRGGERNRRERSKNLSNQFNERTRAINQLLFFRRDPRGEKCRNATRWRGGQMHFTSHRCPFSPPPPFLTFRDAAGELISVIISRSCDSSSDSFYMDNWLLLPSR